MGSTEPGGAFEMESESDYEYEYSDETEDFYFTLDVTSHGISGTSKQDQATPNKRSKGKQPATSLEQLQVLDLHSDNPLIKLGDSFYSCHWSSDLGTQFYVAKAGTFKDSLRPGYVLDVLGTSQARLTGKPVTLHRRDAKPSAKNMGTSPTNAIVLDDGGDQVMKGAATDSTAPENTLVNKNIRRLSAVRSKARDPNVKAQVSFLERLAIIKQRKGEKDVVPVYGIDELSSRDKDSISAGASLNSNGKRVSPAAEAMETPEANGSNQKRRSPVAEDGVDGDLNSTNAASFG